MIHQIWELIDLRFRSNTFPCDYNAEIVRIADNNNDTNGILGNIVMCANQLLGGAKHAINAIDKMLFHSPLYRPIYSHSLKHLSINWSTSLAYVKIRHQ